MPKLRPDEMGPDSEAEDSDGLDTIPAKSPPKPQAEKATSTTKKAKKQEQDEAMDEDDQEDEEDDDEASEVFVVEEIVSHDFADNGAPLYKVKWLGYPNAADQTWEPEENLIEGARDVLDAYHKKIGGKPVDEAKQQKGRGRGKRKSEAASGSPAPKRAKTTNGDNNKRGAFVPPEGSWEDAVLKVHTITEDVETDSKGRPSSGLKAYLIWKDGRKAVYSLALVRIKCPQKLLDYYEQNLSWKAANNDDVTTAS